MSFARRLLDQGPNRKASSLRFEAMTSTPRAMAQVHVHGGDEDDSTFRLWNVRVWRHLSLARVASGLVPAATGRDPSSTRLTFVEVGVSKVPLAVDRCQLH